MKIAFIGHNDFGKATLEAFIARGDTIAGVFCAPEKPGEKPDPVRLAAQAHGLPLFQLKSLRNEAAVQAMRELDADLGVMAYVLQFASQDFVNTPRHGTIQYHPSLLPLHRGPSSINWPIALGATETGLTIFRPTDGLDEGPVILQKAVPIGPDDTLGDVYFKKLFPLGVQALLEASTLVMAGGHTEQAQDEAGASYEGWFHEVESKIHWGNHVDQIYNLIRACNPAPGLPVRLPQAHDQPARPDPRQAGRDHRHHRRHHRVRRPRRRDRSAARPPRRRRQDRRRRIREGARPGHRLRREVASRHSRAGVPRHSGRASSFPAYFVIPGLLRHSRRTSSFPACFVIPGVLRHSRAGGNPEHPLPDLRALLRLARPPAGTGCSPVTLAGVIPGSTQLPHQVRSMRCASCSDREWPCAHPIPTDGLEVA
jgi:methionyl-tRNA formyltransferase